MDIAIVKYNAGNIQSVLYALERIGESANVTDDPAQLAQADKVIFPGVGEASTAMDYLQSHKLDSVIKNLKQPVLGICLGMQLMCTFSEENDTRCLGIFEEKVSRFPQKEGFKVPQMGWNTIFDLQSPLMEGLDENAFCYFVHSYCANVGADTIATTDYILPFSAALHKDNFWGCQFHPEKSAAVGEQILKNFIYNIH